MDLKTLQWNWNEFGRRNPFGSIFTLVHPEGQLPEWDKEQFFQTGVQEIGDALTLLDALPVDVNRGRALDFGCGVGRLTQALGGQFQKSVGVDIAPSMVELAREYNALGERCTYHVNSRADLGLFADDEFDFVYSTVVLQHISPEYSRHYIREFVRVLAPGGVAIFDLPSELAPPRQPLPAEAWRASLELVDAPSRFEAGARRTLKVVVRNSSPVEWPEPTGTAAAEQLRLGNHWLDRRGQMIVQDDGRTEVPAGIGPGEATALSLTVQAPDRAGVYMLELDLVQEGVSWFAARGSRPATMVAFVAPSLAPVRALRDRLARVPRSAPAPDDTAPLMEMHCVPRSEVTEIVESSGGRILRIDESHAAGDAWITFRYCIGKAP